MLKSLVLDGFSERIENTLKQTSRACFGGKTAYTFAYRALKSVVTQARRHRLPLATTWTHLMARAMVRPLIGTGVTPNHLTTLRLVSGVAACAAVALGTPTGALWGGILWLVSAFLDRADGELARIGDMMSAKGHAYDYFSDALVNSLVFAAAGIGARHGWLGVWAAPIGMLAMAAMLVCWVVGERFQKLEGSGQKAYAGHWGFDMDDGLYLIAPFIWFGLMSFVVVGAAAATSVMAVIILVRYQRLRARRT